MKFVTAIIFAICTICYAAPFQNSKYTTRDVDLQAETDRLLFEASMSEFQTARNAQDPPELDWDSNGCTASPDEPLGYDFQPSCQRHDFGYRNYKLQTRFTDDAKDKIDSNFKSDMYNECGKHDTLGKAVCKGVANVYYEAVSAFGGRKRTSSR